MRLRATVAGAVLLLTLSVSAQQAPAATVVIDAGTIIAEVSERAFGANFGTLTSIPVDLIDAARESGITYLRFPGGRVGDLSDLQPGQIDLFMTLACRLLSCIPAISVRLENGTPEKAAEIVRYVNQTKRYGVRYWSIGNEANLFDDYTAEQAATEWRAIAEAMLEADPDIVFVGPDVSQFTGVENEPGVGRAHEFLREFLRVNGDLVDIVSVHRYPFPKSMDGDPTTIADLQTDARRWTEIAANLRQYVLEGTGRELPIAFTEVNSHWSATLGGEATSDSFANALWWADVFGQLLSSNVDIIAYYTFQSTNALGGFGLLASFEVRPTYYVYPLFDKFGSQVVSAISDSDDVRAYAALRDDGVLTVVLVNWNEAEADVMLDVHGAVLTGAETEVWTLTEADNLTSGVNDALSADGQVQLPGRSVTLIAVPIEME